MSAIQGSSNESYVCTVFKPDPYRNQSFINLFKKEIDELRNNMAFNMEMTHTVSLIPGEYVKAITELVIPQFNYEDLKQPLLTSFYASLDIRIRSFVQLLMKPNHQDFFSFYFSFLGLFYFYLITTTKEKLFFLQNTKDARIEFNLCSLVNYYRGFIAKSRDRVIGPGFQGPENLYRMEIDGIRKVINTIKLLQFTMHSYNNIYKDEKKELSAHSKVIAKTRLSSGQFQALNKRIDSITEFMRLYKPIKARFNCLSEQVKKVKINFNGLLAFITMFSNLDKYNLYEVVLINLLYKCRSLLNKPNMYIFICLFSQYLIKFSEARTKIFLSETKMMHGFLKKVFNIVNVQYDDIAKCMNDVQKDAERVCHVLYTRDGLRGSIKLVSSEVKKMRNMSLIGCKKFDMRMTIPVSLIPSEYIKYIKNHRKYIKN